MNTQPKHEPVASSGRMTAWQIARVQADYALLEPNARAVGVALYGRLFELEPATRGLFSQSIAVHADNLMAALGKVVASLDDLPAVTPMVRALARRHACYGVTSAHILTGGVALMDILESGLGAGFTREAREAWSIAYGALAGLMIDAMEDAQADHDLAMGI